MLAGSLVKKADKDKQVNSKLASTNKSIKVTGTVERSTSKFQSSKLANKVVGNNNLAATAKNYNSNPNPGLSSNKEDLRKSKDTNPSSNYHSNNTVTTPTSNTTKSIKVGFSSDKKVTIVNKLGTKLPNEKVILNTDEGKHKEILSTKESAYSKDSIKEIYYSEKKPFKTAPSKVEDIKTTMTEPSAHPHPASNIISNNLNQLRQSKVKEERALSPKDAKIENVATESSNQNVRRDSTTKKPKGIKGKEGVVKEAVEAKEKKEEKPAGIALSEAANSRIKTSLTSQTGQSTAVSTNRNIINININNINIVNNYNNPSTGINQRLIVNPIRPTAKSPTNNLSGNPNSTSEDRTKYLKKRLEEIQESELLDNKVHREILNSISNFALLLKSQSKESYFESLLNGGDSSKKIDKLKKGLDEYNFMLKNKLDKISLEMGKDPHKQKNSSKQASSPKVTVKDSKDQQHKRLLSNQEIYLYDCPANQKLFQQSNVTCLEPKVKEQIINDIYLTSDLRLKKYNLLFDFIEENLRDIQRIFELNYTNKNNNSFIITLDKNDEKSGDEKSGIASKQELLPDLNNVLEDKNSFRLSSMISNNKKNIKDFFDLENKLSAIMSIQDSLCDLNESEMQEFPYDKHVRKRNHKRSSNKILNVNDSLVISSINSDFYKNIIDTSENLGNDNESNNSFSSGKDEDKDCNNSAISSIINFQSDQFIDLEIINANDDDKNKNQEKGLKKSKEKKTATLNLKKSKIPKNDKDLEETLKYENLEKTIVCDLTSRTIKESDLQSQKDENLDETLRSSHEESKRTDKTKVEMPVLNTKKNIFATDQKKVRNIYTLLDNTTNQNNNANAVVINSQKNNIRITSIQSKANTTKALIKNEDNKKPSEATQKDEGKGNCLIF